MKRTISSVLVLGMIAALLSIFAGVASAADDQGKAQITVVNGTDATVSVTATAGAGTIDLGKNLGMGDIGTPATVDPGDYTIAFNDGSKDVATYKLTVPPVSAWTVVSGYGDPNDSNAANAAAYQVNLDEATPAIVFANSSAGGINVTPSPGDIPQGKAGAVVKPDHYSITPATGTAVDVDLSGVPATSSTHVVAVGADATFTQATVTIDDLAALKASLSPQPPTPGTVPDVVDTTQADAEKAITDAGFAVGNVTQAPDDTIVAGNVISQDPAAGAAANPGDAVDLVVSTGPDQGTVKVPDVAGKNAADAQAELEKAGLVVTSEDKPSPDVEAGKVIETDPSAGTEVASGSDVTMYVSSGPEGIVVPDLVGLTQDKASEAAESAGLTVKFVEDPDNPDPDAVVASQEPASGDTVQPGTEIVAQLAPKSGDVIVPNIVGMTQDDAKNAVEAAGLTITFVEDPKNPDPDGIVVAQDPAAGAGVEPDTEVSAQLAPKVDDAWVIVTLSPERVLTVAGINFQPGSTVTITVVDSGKTVTATVQPDGSWTASADLSNVDNAEGTLLIEGTAADGSTYSETFKVPAAGESTTEPTEATTESSGMPVWGWILIALAVAGLIALGVKMFGGGSSDGGGDTPPASDAPTGDTN